DYYCQSGDDSSNHDVF
nr:immunoglobulin light chain junction region [Macaca mulatta]MOW56523.1 immunoglobulin light chain junction region [Macaca mulatta]MOW57464.1 immunoglobulin light chain junction region [Macaca mulatta]MOW57476.1 immunoglobulin light chain junction region [Macaca mulatta]MOW57551.1 immunoglobulin light chain junction region [Macaca mulatta]